MESRVPDTKDAIRRRRECQTCGRRFTTYERVEDYLPSVVKKDGRRETFDRLKVLAGLKKACEKRPISVETIEETADAIERNLLEAGDKEVPSSVVGEAIMMALHDLDSVAYVRFASVYRNFREAKDFEEFITDELAEEAD